MIAAVLVDLFETLVTERHAPPTRASSLGERFGLDDIAFRKAWKAQRSRVVRGQLSLAAAWIEIGAQLGRGIDPAVAAHVCEERARQKSAMFEHVDPDTLAVLRQLRELKIKLAIVSNCCAEDVHGWPRCAAAEWFDASVFSFDIGAAKPEPLIYREAARRLGVDPSAAVFVGDGGDDEIPGAERAGVRAAQATWFRGELVDLPAHIPRLSSWQDVLRLVATG